MTDDLHTRLDVLNVRAGLELAIARERNERWDGVFEERFDVAQEYGWLDGPL